MNFQQEANKAQLDLTADSEETRKTSIQLMKWDRKKKKMVADNKVNYALLLSSEYHNLNFTNFQFVSSSLK